MELCAAKWRWIVGSEDKISIVCEDQKQNKESQNEGTYHCAQGPCDWLQVEALPLVLFGKGCFATGNVSELTFRKLLELLEDLLTKGAFVFLFKFEDTFFLRSDRVKDYYHITKRHVIKAIVISILFSQCGL